MRSALVLTAATLCLTALPSLAQGVPSNPFASNYPSAPPRGIERDGRLYAPRGRRPLPPRRFERGPIPPGDVPGR